MALSDSRYLLHNGSGKGQTVYKEAGGAGGYFSARLSAGADAFGTVLSRGWLYCYVMGNWGWVNVTIVGMNVTDRGVDPTPIPDPDPNPIPADNTEMFLFHVVEGVTIAIDLNGVRIWTK